MQSDQSHAIPLGVSAAALLVHNSLTLTAPGVIWLSVSCFAQVEHRAKVDSLNKSWGASNGGSSSNVGASLAAAAVPASSEDNGAGPAATPAATPTVAAAPKAAEAVTQNGAETTELQEQHGAGRSQQLAGLLQVRCGCG